jgi:AAA domain
MAGDSASQATYAAEYLKHLLNGGSPNGAPPDAFGDYRNIIENLHLAHDAGGTAKVKEAWNEALRRHPALAGLVSGDRPTSERQVRWTADELLAATFQPIQWVVPHVLSEGLTVLAGRPKLGKSWLALQIAQAVACAGRVFEHTVERGAVLYIALEDSERRLQKRMHLQHWLHASTATFYTAWKPLDTGGLPSLDAEMAGGGYRLVVIDTLSRALSGQRNQNEVGEMTGVFSTLQRLALERRAAILLVDHHSKPRGMNPDPVDDILGSTGKGAAADIVMGLYRERGKKGAILRVVGRDLDEDKNLALEWDPQWCCWQLLGDEAEVAKGSLQATILDAFARLGGAATTTAVAEYIGKDKGNLSREIAELVQKGKLERGGKQGREQPYRLAGALTEEPQASQRDAPGQEERE